MTDIEEAVRVVARFDGTANHIMRYGEDGPCAKCKFARGDSDWTEECYYFLPDYAHDRDALIEVAKKLSPLQQADFAMRVYHKCAALHSFRSQQFLALLFATPEQLLLCLAQTIKEGKSL